MGLPETRAALMPGSMTLAPLNASAGFGQLMIYLRSDTFMQALPSLSCIHSCIVFVFPPYINDMTLLTTDNSWKLHLKADGLLYDPFPIIVVFLFETSVVISIHICLII